MADEPSRTLQKVSCLCGAQIRLDPTNRNRHVTCPSCGSTFDFVVSIDPGRKRSKISIVLSPDAMKTEGESLGNLGKASRPSAKAASTPPAKPIPRATRVTRKVGGKTTKAIMGNCECGASFPLEETDELTILQTCPQCNTLYHVVFKLEPGTRQKTAMLVPERPKLPKSRTMAKPAPPLFPDGSPATPDDLRVTDFFTPASRKGGKKSANTKARTKPKPPPEIPPGAQGVPCSCGTIFVVRRRDLGGEMTCEGCGETAAFEETRDPQSLAPVIRIRKS